MKKLLILPLFMLSLTSFAGGEGDGGGGPAITMLKKIEIDIVRKFKANKDIKLSSLNVDPLKGFVKIPVQEVGNVVTSEGFIDIQDLLDRSNLDLSKNPFIEIPKDSNKVQSIQLIDGSIFFVN